MNFALPKKLAGILSLLVSFCLILGCKPAVNQDLKTLENFAAQATLRKNQCASPENSTPPDLTGLSVRVEAPGTNEKELQREVVTALSALPQSFLSAMAMMKVRFLLTSNVGQICSAGINFLEKTETRVSCLISINEAPKVGLELQEGVIIVIAPTANYIRHLLVRTVGYFFTKTLGQRLSIRTPQVSLQPADFVRLQMRVAISFITDIVEQNIFDVSNLDNLLGSGTGIILKQNIAAIKSVAKADLFANTNIPEERLLAFIEQMTADAFDSFYCRSFSLPGQEQGEIEFINQIRATRNLSLFEGISNTRLIMEAFFPKTTTEYLALNEHIHMIAGALEAIWKSIKPRSNAQSGAFALGENTPTQQNGPAARQYEKVKAEYDAYAAKKAAGPSWFEMNVMGWNQRDWRDNQRSLNSELEARFINAKKALEAEKGTGPKNYARASEQGYQSKYEAMKIGWHDGGIAGLDSFLAKSDANAKSIAVAASDIADTTSKYGASAGLEKTVSMGYNGLYSIAEQIGKNWDQVDKANPNMNSRERFARYWWETAKQFPYAGATAQTVENSTIVYNNSTNPATGRPYTVQEIADRQASASVAAQMDLGSTLLGNGVGSSMRVSSRWAAAGVTQIHKGFASVAANSTSSSARTAAGLVGRFTQPVVNGANNVSSALAYYFPSAGTSIAEGATSTTVEALGSGVTSVLKPFATGLHELVVCQGSTWIPAGATGETLPSASKPPKSNEIKPASNANSSQEK